MKANSTHISLETAKLLKDCGVESNNVFMNTIEGDPDDGWKISKSINGVGEYPAYTWQEILWEYPQEFFGVIHWEAIIPSFGGIHWEEIIPSASYCDEVRQLADILNLLQQKKYNKADKLFRDNCILIK